jgi:hypothetical protein
MKFDDILLQAKELGIYERRSLSAEYCELVFFSRDLEGWYGILSTALGEPRKPPGQEPSESDLDLTHPTGGIRINQTLFEKDFGKKTLIAKIWPWDDGERMTLKMAVLFN